LTGDRLLGLRAVLDQLDLREDAVDAELDGEARGQGLEMDVARADHQRVAQRGAHQAHDFARLVADRLERQVLDAPAIGGPDGGLRVDIVEGAHRFLVRGQEGDQVAAVHQAPAERLGDALLGPGVELPRKRIVEGEHQPSVGAAKQRAAALRAFAEGQKVESRTRLS